MSRRTSESEPAALGAWIDHTYAAIRSMTHTQMRPTGGTTPNRACIHVPVAAHQGGSIPALLETV